MMNQEKLARILLVDDDVASLDVLVECLKDEPYEVAVAHDGGEALELLAKDMQEFHVIVLDRMMPGMNGLEVVTHLQDDEAYKWIPVVMQTAAAAPAEICEGVEAGVFFYLTKPYEPDVLLRIVGAAVEQSRRWKELSQTLRVQAKTMGCLYQGEFRIRMLEETYDLAVLLAQACPNPEKVAFGFNELLVNSLEHGNLGITYEEKTQLQEADSWEDEILRRQDLPEHAEKFVEVVFERYPGKIQVTITDQGPGFNWGEYEEIKTDRMLESHGRGIAIAKALSFDSLEYVGPGNKVICLINLVEKDQSNESAAIEVSQVVQAVGSVPS